MKNAEMLEKIKKSITTNWGLKLLAVFIAFVLWFVVVQVEDPTEAVNFNNIKVNLTNKELLDGENKVYSVAEGSDNIRVTVKAPKSVVGKLRASDIVAEADVSKLTDINTVKINCSIPGFDVDSIESSRDSVKLVIENKKSKYIRIENEVLGNVEKGFIVSSITTDQNLVEISGPESIIDRVQYGKVSIDVSGATSTVSANVDIQLYDNDNKSIDVSGTSMTVSYVHMSVEVLETKTVPVYMNYSGTPADGYMATGEVNVSPSTIKIAGKSKDLPVISKMSIPADAVDITGVTDTYTTVVKAEDYLPAGSVLADDNELITLTVYVEPVFDKGIVVPKENITLLNISEDYEVSLADGNWNLTAGISGLKADVDAFDPASVNAVADLGEWFDEQEDTVKPGDYWVPVNFEEPENVSLIEPGEILITVAKREAEKR